MTIPTPGHERQTLDVKHAAKRLGIGRDAVYALINSGRLRSITIGRRRIIPMKELDNFLDRECAVSPVLE